MSHAQAYPSYHAGSSSSSVSFDSQVPSYRAHTPSLESDRTSLEHQRSHSPHQSRRYSQRRPLSPAERQYAAMTTTTTSAPAPAPAPPQDVHDPMRVRHDTLGRFFGEQLPPSSQQQPSHYRTHSQSHRVPREAEDAPAPRYSSSQGRAGRSAPVLPPYDSRTEIESLPVYSKESEYDAELNRKLFIYGFLFFPLWIVGIIAPFVTPHRDPVKDNRSKEAQDAEDASMRAVELMWAKRCGAALTAFLFIIIAAVAVGVTIANHK